MSRIWKFATMSPDERKDWLSIHLVYEVEGLVLGLRGITPFYRTYKLPEESDNEYGGRASLELFLLHARGLIGFFYSKGGNYDDNAKASDYTQNVDFQDLLKSKYAYLDEEFRQISKYLAHISYSRMEIRRWNCIKLYNELIELTTAFLKAIASNKTYGGIKLNNFEAQVDKLKLISPQKTTPRSVLKFKVK